MLQSDALQKKLLASLCELEGFLSEPDRIPRSSLDLHAHRSSLRKVQIDRVRFTLRKDLWETIPLLFLQNDPKQLIAILSQSVRLESPEERLDAVKQLRILIMQISFVSTQSPHALISFELPLGVPDVLRLEMQSDLQELEKTFHAGCYRACVILCGRLLEMALHRIYYERTGFDILEKNPGIGLGTLIAKLTEKQVSFDPGLTQQIHLINQVRIYSVHKKQASFVPTKAQAQAMILYTLDILQKLFP